jgi:hypothetical protein
MSVISWLSDQPFWVTAFVLIIGSVSFAVLGRAAAGLYVGERQLSLNNIVGGFKYLFLSMVYAGFLGFLLFGVYKRYDAVRTDVVQEATDLSTLDALAAAFPPATRDQLRRALADYARRVVGVEWPQLRRRTANPVTMTALDTLDAVYAALQPATEKQREVMRYSNELLASIRNKRAMRVFRSRGTMQILLWAVTLVGTGVSIMLPWVFGGPNVNATLLMSALSTLLMASIVLLILELSYPFAGKGISPAPYVDFIREASQPH